MLLPALVLDTNNFSFNGTIKVRIARYYLDTMQWDMTDDLNFIKKGLDPQTGQHGDYDVYVFTPYGGGKNCSLFFMPQVNSKGLVMPIASEGADFIWMGSYSEPLMDKNGVVSIPIPNQDPEVEASPGILSGSCLNDDPNAIILRTKSTAMVTNYNNLDNETSKDFNWDIRQTENLIIIDRDKIHIRHFGERDDEGKALIYEDIFIGSTIEKDDEGYEESRTDSITITYTNSKTEDNKFKTTATIDDKGLNINYSSFDKSNKKKANNSIEIDEEAVRMKATWQDNKSVSIEAGCYGNSKTEKAMFIIGDSSISMEKDKISLVAKDAVYVSAKEVRLGGMNQSVVTTASPLSSFELPGGVILNTSKNVFG